jgi:hypothetical protein
MLGAPDTRLGITHRSAGAFRGLHLAILELLCPAWRKGPGPTPRKTP